MVHCIPIGSLLHTDHIQLYNLVKDIMQFHFQFNSCYVTVLFSYLIFMQMHCVSYICVMY